MCSFWSIVSVVYPSIHFLYRKVCLTSYGLRLELGLALG